MSAYVILFRGVGGATQLPVAPLRAALTGAGFENVATYINSGNAVVKSRLGREAVVAAIADICRAKFGFDKAIYAPTLAEWEAVVAANPFPVAPGEGAKLHAAWLDGPARPDDVAALRTLAVGGEAIEVIGQVAYLATPNGVGISKFASRFDRGIGVPNTARNWNTVLKLLELGRRAAQLRLPRLTPPPSKPGAPLPRARRRPIP